MRFNSAATLILVVLLTTVAVEAALSFGKESVENNTRRTVQRRRKYARSRGALAAATGACLAAGVGGACAYNHFHNRPAAASLAFKKPGAGPKDLHYYASQYRDAQRQMATTAMSVVLETCAALAAMFSPDPATTREEIVSKVKEWGYGVEARLAPPRDALDAWVDSQPAAVWNYLKDCVKENS